MKTNINPAILILSSVICLLPVILALVVYDDLPERIPMQWNLEGNPNWYAHKAVGAFGLPLFLMALNIFSRMVIHNDPKKENASKVMRLFAEWIVPVISLMVVPIILFMGIGKTIPVKMIVFIFIGIVFIILGNYMPKSRQNYTMGFRLPWTLNDPENWNKTHRLAGYLWIMSGILFIVIAFLSLENAVGLVIIFIVLLTLVLAPSLYSYRLYKKEKGVNV